MSRAAPGLRVAFAGTPDIAAAALAAIHGAGHAVPYSATLAARAARSASGSNARCEPKPPAVIH